MWRTFPITTIGRLRNERNYWGSQSYWQCPCHRTIVLLYIVLLQSQCLLLPLLLDTSSYTCLHVSLLKMFNWYMVACILMYFFLFTSSLDWLDETYSCILFGESNLRIKLSERPLLYRMCIQGSKWYNLLTNYSIPTSLCKSPCVSVLSNRQSQYIITLVTI